MDLESTRRHVDEIDRKIVALLNLRAELALQIKTIKAKEGKAVLDLEREAQVYENLLSANEGPLPAASLKAIYREVISACRQLQNSIRVAYLGPMATFTHQAARTKFGASAEYIAARSISEVFALAEKGAADFGVVPVENSTEGFVGHTLDMLADSDLKICAEIALPISHCLLSKGSHADIRTVYSHPQALAQTRGWLQQHLPGAEQVEVSSTARAAEIAAGDTSAAAIGTELSCEVYGLNVIARRIEDNPGNVTRFLVIGKEMGRRTGNDKTSVMFTIKDRVGALHDALDVLLRHDINLTRIESRPSKRKAWDYVFFIDIVGHAEDQEVSTALAELAATCVFVKVLGAWTAE